MDECVVGPKVKEQQGLAADPARRAGIGRVGAHFARKAQPGFAPRPLPE